MLIMLASAAPTVNQRSGKAAASLFSAGRGGEVGVERDDVVSVLSQLDERGAIGLAGGGWWARGAGCGRGHCSPASISSSA